MAKTRREPRWATLFLRALERTGVVRSAAESAGVDYTTAYARRQTHAEFAEAWVAAKAAHKATKARGEEAPSTSCAGPPPPPAATEDLVGSGKQLKRASGERWGARKQEAFLAELSVTANYRRASKAVGLSYEAVRKRRLKDPKLEAACIAAIAACRARAPEFLASAMAATFDPEAALDAEPNALPRVSVAEAIKMAQLWGQHSEPEVAPRDIEGVRQRLEAKMRALNLINDEALARRCPRCGQASEEE